MEIAVRGPVVAFLPCRKGSERVPLKNIRPFGPFSHGLIEIKLRQLLSCGAIDRVVLSTNDDEILSLANDLCVGDRLVIHRRDESLCSSATSTDDLVAHAAKLIVPLSAECHILWTHVTSPFVTAWHYAEIIAEYAQALSQGHDSLMTTTPLHSFLWSESGPINYDRAVEKWPRTQTLIPVQEVNSAGFLAPASIYASHNDRIGPHPKLFPLDRMVSLDIDWEEDFMIAEQLLVHGLVKT
jgi:CMP-N-acetylneuraminic acid synthetase